MTTRACWLALYAMLCAAEFVISWAKDAVKDKVKGTPEPPKP